MEEIELTTDNPQISQAYARSLAEEIACEGNQEAMLISWYNRISNACSP